MVLLAFFPVPGTPGIKALGIPLLQLVQVALQNSLQALPDEVLQKTHCRADVPFRVIPHFPLNGEDAFEANVV